MIKSQELRYFATFTRINVKKKKIVSVTAIRLVLFHENRMFCSNDRKRRKFNLLKHIWKSKRITGINFLKKNFRIVRANFRKELYLAEFFFLRIIQFQTLHQNMLSPMRYFFLSFLFLFNT